MSSTIRILDELTINQIAAGEVIENPASVVKEIVENSIDAGATEIHVDISCGGRQLIRISDNGCGMGKDDALLCLERHATSKIRQADDLEALLTMGFRGEALSSIAAVSKLTLMTAPRENKSEGTLVIAEGGRLLKCSPIARAPGTTIEVKSLFFNVPVRKKFQHSPTHDAHEILRVISLLALAHPNIRFELISDQVAVLVAPAETTGNLMQQLRQRTNAVLGEAFLDQMVPLEVSDENCQVVGLISLPAHSRANRTGQSLFINRRAINSPLVSFAVRDGYSTALPSNRYPACVLHLQLSPSLIDVNVHPQKREVRLRQEQQLRALLRQGVSRALNGGETPAPCPAPFNLPDMAERRPLNFSMPISFSPQPIPAPDHDLFRASPPTPQVAFAIPGYLLLDPNSCRHLLNAKEGLCLIDQRAAHHRILSERLSNSSLQAAEVQPLLLPVTIEVTPIEMARIREMLPELARLGIDIQEFGPHTINVQAIPTELEGVDIATWLSELSQELHQDYGAQTSRSERQKRLAGAFSRKLVSRTKKMSREQANQLVAQLFACENPYRCPLGKPTVLWIEPEFLAKYAQG